jgi:hypothetical protein
LFLDGIFILIDCWLFYWLVIGSAVGLLAGRTIGQLVDKIYCSSLRRSVQFLERNPDIDITG